MGRHERDPAVRILLDHLSHLSGSTEVLGVGGLIQQGQARPGPSQGAGECQALSLTAGQCQRAEAGAVLQARARGGEGGVAGELVADRARQEVVGAALGQP